MSMAATARPVAGTLRHVIVHLPSGLGEDMVKRLRRVAETCPARRSLEAGFTFDEQLVLDAGVMACANES
jgi:uncharacterized OsmC-like protein